MQTSLLSYLVLLWLVCCVDFCAPSLLHALNPSLSESQRSLSLGRVRVGLVWPVQSYSASTCHGWLFVSPSPYLLTLPLLCVCYHSYHCSVCPTVCPTIALCALPLLCVCYACRPALPLLCVCYACRPALPLLCVCYACRPALPAGHPHRCRPAHLPLQQHPQVLSPPTHLPEGKL